MRRKVAHVTPWGVHCGIAKHLSYWLPHLRPIRDCVICAETPPWWHQRIESWDTYPSVRCWSRGAADALQSARSVAVDHNARILHLQWDPSFFPFDSLAEYAEDAALDNLRTVVTAHTLVDEDPYVWENKKILGIADQVVAGTPGLVAALTEYAARFQIPLRRPIRYVPLPVPDIGAVPLPPRAEPGPLILAWGFPGALKGCSEVLAAVRLFRRYAPRAHYLVVGRAITGEQRENIDRLAESAADVPGLLEIREGFLPDEEIYRLCRSAEMIVLNHQWNHHSSSGTVALSVASGTPVIVSQSPMFSGYAEAGAVKVVASPGPQAIAAAMAEIWNDERLRARLQAGRAEMMKRICASAVAAEYESIYEELDG